MNNGIQKLGNWHDELRGYGGVDGRMEEIAVSEKGRGWVVFMAIGCTENCT